MPVYPGALRIADDPLGAVDKRCAVSEEQTMKPLVRDISASCRQAVRMVSPDVNLAT